jgi:hypothetical protein
MGDCEPDRRCSGSYGLPKIDIPATIDLSDRPKKYNTSITKITSGDHMFEITNRFWEDWNWAREHMSELMVKYPDKWVAIFEEKVIAANSELGRAEDEARAKISEKRIPLIFVGSGAHVYQY